MLVLVTVSLLLGRLQMRHHREALKMQGVIDGMLFQMFTGLAQLRVANAEPYVSRAGPGSSPGSGARR